MRCQARHLSILVGCYFHLLIASIVGTINSQRFSIEIVSEIPSTASKPEIKRALLELDRSKKLKKYTHPIKSGKRHSTSSSIEILNIPQDKKQSTLPPSSVQSNTPSFRPTTKNPTITTAPSIYPSTIKSTLAPTFVPSTKPPLSKPPTSVPSTSPSYTSSFRITNAPTTGPTAPPSTSSTIHATAPPTTSPTIHATTVVPTFSSKSASPSIER